MSDYQRLKELAQHALDHGPQAWFTRTDLRSGAHIRPADATFMAEASPQVILELIAYAEHPQYTLHPDGSVSVTRNDETEGTTA